MKKEIYYKMTEKLEKIEDFFDTNRIELEEKDK